MGHHLVFVYGLGAEYFQDVWLFDTTAMLWKSLPIEAACDVDTQQTPPQGRFGHSLGLHGKG